MSGERGMQLDKCGKAEAFEQFLIAMDDQIEWLESEAEKRGLPLSLTLDDLERLEQLFDVMRTDGTQEDVVGLSIFFGRYLGEIVRVNCGARWTLPLDDARNVNFNTPVLVGHCPVEGVEFPPLGVMRSYSLRPKAGLLRTALNSQVSPTPIDLNDLAEE
jgi:hypothetical protein